jgi:hypothetical protein
MTPRHRRPLGASPPWRPTHTAKSTRPEQNSNDLVELRESCVQRDSGAGCSQSPSTAGLVTVDSSERRQLGSSHQLGGQSARSHGVEALPAVDVNGCLAGHRSTVVEVVLAGEPHGGGHDALVGDDKAAIGQPQELRHAVGARDATANCVV